MKTYHGAETPLGSQNTQPFLVRQTQYLEANLVDGTIFTMLPVSNCLAYFQRSRKKREGEGRQTINSLSCETREGQSVKHGMRFLHHCLLAIGHLHQRMFQRRGVEYNAE
jgi:hypothetical protein